MILLNSAPRPGAANRNSENIDVKQWLIFAVKAIVSGLLIWWLLERIDPAPVFEGLSRVSAGPLIAALVALMVAAGLLAFRWTAVNRRLEIALQLARAFRLTLIALFFSQTLPSTIGGDVARVWFVYRGGVPMDRAVSSIILDRLCALAALLLIVGLSLPALFSMIDDPTPRWSVPLLAALGACGFGMLFLLGGRWGRLFDRWAATRPILKLARDARCVLVPDVGLVAIFAPAVTIHLLSVFAVWLIAQSIAAEISLLHCLVFVPPVILISMVPISVAGWGIREGAMIVAFGFVGVPEADALVVSILFGLTLIAAGAPGGVLWLSEGRSARQGFDLAQETKRSES